VAELGSCPTSRRSKLSVFFRESSVAEIKHQALFLFIFCGKEKTAMDECSEKIQKQRNIAGIIFRKAN
jgi:hypothetical protein